MLGCGAPAEEETNDAPTEATGRAANALAADITVFGDAALTQPWQNWGWSSTVTTTDTTSPLASGSKSQIKATLTGAWGAVSLARTSGDLDAGSYDSVTFDIRSNAPSKVYFAVQSLGGSAPPAQLPISVTTTWSHQRVSLDSVRGRLSSFGKLNFMAEQAGDTFYVDNVQLIARGTSGTIPNQPLMPAYETVVTVNQGPVPYFLYVPRAYDATNRTPAKLLLWLHGCGGNGYGDAWSVSPGGSQSWISMSLGGRDGDCWDTDRDTSLVMSALADVKKRLNVDPRRVVIGGYSSGGDLAYKTAFYNALSFAGVIAENTSPFRDTGSSASSSTAAAAWRFNIAHVAHLQDETYSIDLVRREMDQLWSAGFRFERIERDGHHWDADRGAYGTQYDRKTFLLPYLDRGWVTP